MASPGTPAEARAFIIERLVGDTGEPDHVIAAARALATRALPATMKGINEQLVSPVEIEVKSVELSRFADARPADVASHAMSVAASASSPDALLLMMNAEAVALFVSCLFGADPDLPVGTITRELSPTEVEVATTIFQEFAQAINGSGERAFDLRMPIAKAMTGATLAKHLLRDGPAVRVTFSIAVGATAGTVSLFMPQRVLLKHRGDGAAAGKGAEQGKEWQARFSEEVMRSAVRVEATMPLARLTLGELASLSEGQVIELAGDGKSQARLSARGNTLFVCELGKLGQNYTVRIKHPFDAGQDLMDGIMPGQASGR